ncbi:aldehyde dehydrogenase (NADP(+)) [Echinicola soli]|uniref:Aldehyde dehydrogenase (NADP(+)) n=1 Tax=Echinicola soli TaxID=2591634 RepID=A0A514CM96_9BACT|nr:aldehyde dehydrogenase (NADP(+)) [Echinicola soli]QDH80936.1 aldehyde dehydrogenase (NADP(+)) [Echinicola soli]
MQLDKVLHQSEVAFEQYKTISLADRASFLRAIADQLEGIKEALIPTACEESNLPEGRITGELGRTTGQIRLFAKYVVDGTWLEATIDHGDPGRTPVPKPDLRRMLVPLGPVAVFGASNFPLAFSTAGGDSISALAAGCTVVYKGHPGHPKTSLMVFEAIQKAIAEAGLPQGVFQHIEGGIAEGQALVQHPAIKAVGFTGSFKGGKALFDLANDRSEPIPVYAEMGSINPIIAFDKALGQQEQVAGQYAQSLTLGAGQFCTNPGVIFVPSSIAASFAQNTGKFLADTAGQKMLHDGIQTAYNESLDKLATSGELKWIQKAAGKETGHPALALTDLDTWIKEEALQEEVFGPFGIVVGYDSKEALLQAARSLQGQLTITLWASEEELADQGALISALQEKCGRLLFGGVPTGVEVGHAMQHGGPFPATTDSRSTSVGVYAIKRFARPFAFQNCPDSLLPDVLKDANPLGIFRTMDGVVGR